MSKVVYIVGSLRKDSYNKKLAERMQEVTGGEVVCLNDMVFMNEDLEANPPKVVSDLREKVVSSDRIVFVSPDVSINMETGNWDEQTDERIVSFAEGL